MPRRTKRPLILYVPSTYMLDEFRRYCALQRSQEPLASLLIYLKLKGGWTQLNQIWKDLGPSSGGPFWNQTTLINKLNKLEKLEIIAIERRVLPSGRVSEKTKTNTFCRLDPASPIAAYVFNMLRVKKMGEGKNGDSERFTSELADRPLDRLISKVEAHSEVDPMVEKERQVAFELIGEVFDIGQEEVEAMIKERLVSRGLITVEREGVVISKKKPDQKIEKENKKVGGRKERSSKRGKSKDKVK